MPRLAQGLAFVFAILVAVSGPFAGSARAADPSVKDMLADKVMGSPDAPVTMIEYASLNCPHCARFHEETLPAIKKAYLDTGKVRLVFRDFPLSNRALAASMVARCAGPVRYFALVALFFREQLDWIQAPDGLAALKKVAKQVGMSADQVDACVRNDDLKQGLRKVADEAGQKQGVDSTPTFFIDGEKLEGEQPFKNFQDVIDRALSKKKK